MKLHLLDGQQNESHLSALVQFLFQINEASSQVLKGTALYHSTLTDFAQRMTYSSRSRAAFDDMDFCKSFI